MRKSFLLAACLMTACSGSADAPDPGHLVVIGADGSVTSVDPDGGEPEILTDREASVPAQATASSDGEVVVWSDVTADGRFVAVIHDEAGPREIEVPSVPFFYAFAPGGARLAALGNHPDGAGVALILVDLSDDTAELVEAGQPYFLDWSPDGASLAVHVGADVLGVVGIDGARTTIDVRPGPFSAPAWTDDERIVAVVATDQVTASAEALQASTFMIAVVDPAEGSAEVVTRVDEAAAFDVAGSRIAYLEGDSGLGPLTVAGLDGSGSVEVAAGDVVSFEWSPDGQSLLYHTLEEASLVPRVWDGEDVTDYGGYVPTESLLTQYLPFWAQYTRTITQWSPDSSAFSYPATESGDPGIVWIQPLDGEREEIGPGEMVTWAR